MQILDKTGALANVKRHDYLPFGEELFADTGQRTTTQGYTPVGSIAADGARQKFTSQERDNETGLDYMHARYFASVQGRFGSADSFSGSIGNPQSLNRYAYVVNNPINLSDPTGHEGRFNPHSASTHWMNQHEGTCTPQHPCQEYPEDWASSGNHPQQGLIQETVNVNISNQTPLETTTTNLNPTLQLQGITPSVGPASGSPTSSSPALGPSGNGLFGIDFGAFAGAAAGGGFMASGDVSVGINTNGNGGMGAAAGLGVVAGGSPVGGGYGYPSAEGWGLGAAVGASPGIFWSNAEDFQQLQGDFNTTIVATPWLTFQWDQSSTDNTRKISLSGPSVGAGIFHFPTTTPKWTTVDFPVTIPLRRY